MVYTERTYYVYILACHNRRLYVGVTNSLRRRVAQHKAGVNDGFTKRYHINQLVYFETFGHIRHAIAREKKLKNMHRDRKIALIESVNPCWIDQAAGWYTDEDLQAVRAAFRSEETDSDGNSTIS